MVLAVAVSGLGIVCPDVQNTTELSEKLNHGNMELVNLSELGNDELPYHQAPVFAEFDARALLGTRGANSLDRGTALVLVACARALEDCTLHINEDNRHRVGAVLGTTCGSLKSMCDFTVETFVEDRPYLVNPLAFPNTVMNFAAGQVAIRYGLKGVNATVAGERMAFLNALRYAISALRLGYVDTLLAGAFEEFTSHRAMTTWFANHSDRSIPAGEGAAVFILERLEECRSRRGEVYGEILGVSTGYSPVEKLGAGLAGHIRQALHQAGVSHHHLAHIATGEYDVAASDGAETEAINKVLGSHANAVKWIQVQQSLGELHAACGAFQLAALLSLHASDPRKDGQLSLLTNCTQDGSVGAAVIRGWSHVGAHRQ